MYDMLYSYGLDNIEPVVLDITKKNGLGDEARLARSPSDSLALMGA